MAAVARAGAQLGVSLLLVLALTSCARRDESGEAAAAAKRPNIVYILADDLGYSDIGAFGGEIPTPNLDALASGGMLLTNFYAHMSCSPTRAMIMSGMDNHLSGIGVQPRRIENMRKDQIGQPGYEGYLNFRVAALPELLTDAGYNTYMIGKWHMGDEVPQGPHARGFKHVFSSFDGAAHLGGWDWRGPQPSRYWDDDNIVNVGDDWYTTRDYTKKMIGFIEQDRADGKPFFAWMAYTAPHWPLQAPKESIAKFKGLYDDGYEATYARRFARQKELGLVAKDAEPIDNARFSPRWADLSAADRAAASRRMEVYAAMVSDLDTYVGEFIAYLKQIGEYDNTFIIFSSDNGAEQGQRETTDPNIRPFIGKEYDNSVENMGSSTSYLSYGPNWAYVSASPFYRHKATAYEGGIHVPAFVNFPKFVKPGTRSNEMGHVRDLLPTFLELAGGQLPGATYKGRDVLPVQGVSLLPVFRGEHGVHSADEVFGWEHIGPRSIRQGDWKLVWDQASKPEDSRWYLFNIANDPSEQHDLSAAEPERVKQMQVLWEQFDEQNGVIY